MTRSGFASGLSILLIATTSGTLPAFACAIASFVCGITPSSAATTSTTMSVTLAPRARIAVNASWPGVSRNVIMPFGVYDVISADVLRDAAGLAARDARAADRVEQRRLAVVDVTHDGDDRRTRQRIGRVRLLGVDEHRVGIVELGRLGLVAHFLDDDHRRFLVEHLVDRHHRAELHQRLDHFGGLDRHPVREVGDGDRLGHEDLAHHRPGLHWLPVTASPESSSRP